jgi:high-affinity iron transporter
MPGLPKNRSEAPGGIMLQAFIIVLREGFESFLIIAITLAYLGKTGQSNLIPAVYSGVIASVLVSAALGYWLYQGASGPLWEGVFALVSAVLIGAFVIHMWKMAPHLKQDMEKRLTKATAGKPARVASLGVFLFTVFMISREGMETALLLMQIHTSEIVTGMVLGLLAVIAMALLWLKLSIMINLKLFFQVTAIFLMLFVAQVLLYAFHEFTEAGIFPNSEALHAATEVYSPDGLYGKWFSLGMVFICGIWLLGAWVKEMISNSNKTARA